VTEADWKTWSDVDLEPFVETALAAFDPRRMMVGSDWPVCLLATTYRGWFDTVGRLIGSLSVVEKERILGGTAIEVYQLHD
jgi:L-fuconolactonase